MVNNDQLRRDMSLLEEMLRQIVSEDEGRDAVELVAEIRHLARDRRSNVPVLKLHCHNASMDSTKIRLGWWPDR